MMKTIYLTTSIAYVNAPPHIGFLLEVLSADILKRYYQQRGEKVFFLTGTDEHGQKVLEAAKNAKQPIEEYVRTVSEKFKALGKDFQVEYDYFIRTSEPAHKEFVQKVWLQLLEKGDLEKRSYQAKYCRGCEAFKTEHELEQGICPVHQRQAEIIEEDNWFFKSSKYLKEIEQWLEKSPVYPASRLEEVRLLLKDGLEDISVSRPSDKVGWGIAVPNDKTQVIYVWFEALLNYLSALELTKGKAKNYWPADCQIIGKDILRFHAIIWPAMLSALGLPLPKKLLVHGFVNVEGKKMSKSLGNVIEPEALRKRYGSQASRYLLFRQLPFYEDSNFVWGDFDALYHGELSNGLGNLISRIIGLLKGFERKISVKPIVAEYFKESIALEPNWQKNHCLERADFSGELNLINKLLVEADGYISTARPWEWSKSESLSAKTVNDFLTKCQIAQIIYRLEPFISEISALIRDNLLNLKSEALFPRLEDEK